MYSGPTACRWQHMYSGPTACRWQHMYSGPKAPLHVNVCSTYLNEAGRLVSLRGARQRDLRRHIRLQHFAEPDLHAGVVRVTHAGPVRMTHAGPVRVINKRARRLVPQIASEADTPLASLVLNKQTYSHKDTNQDRGGDHGGTCPRPLKPQPKRRPSLNTAMLCSAPHAHCVACVPVCVPCECCACLRVFVHMHASSAVWVLAISHRPGGSPCVCERVYVYVYVYVPVYMHMTVDLNGEITRMPGAHTYDTQPQP